MTHNIDTQFVHVTYIHRGVEQSTDMLVGARRAKVLTGRTRDEEGYADEHEEAMERLKYFVARQLKAPQNEVIITSVDPAEEEPTIIRAEDLHPDMLPEQQIIVKYTIGADTTHITDIITVPQGVNEIIPLEEKIRVRNSSRKYGPLVKACKEALKEEGYGHIDIIELSPVSIQYFHSFARNEYNLTIIGGEPDRTKRQELTRYNYTVDDDLLRTRGVMWYGTYYSPMYRHGDAWYVLSEEGDAICVGEQDIATEGRYADMQAEEAINLGLLHTRPEKQTLKEAFEQSLEMTLPAARAFDEYFSWEEWGGQR